MKDIFRAYPNHFEYTLPTLCEGLTSLDQPEAKAALIWIVGEYAARIENASLLIETFCEMFTDEPETVQLQLLTTSVKAFIQLKDSRSQQTQQKQHQKGYQTHPNKHPKKLQQSSKTIPKILLKCRVWGTKMMAHGDGGMGLW